MRRLLTDPRWWGLLLLAMAIAVASIYLGRWQYGRWQDRLERNDSVAAAVSQEAVAVADVLSITDPVDPQSVYRPVTVRGSYGADSVVLVRNRPLDGRNGYRMLAGLQTEEGPLLVVDRGWIPAGRTAAAPDQVPPLPTGVVTLVGRVRTDEPTPSADPALPPGQTVAISSSVVGEEPRYDGYVELISETPSVQPAPIPPPLPPGGAGPHLYYALQWWFFGVLAFVGLIILSRRPRDAVSLAEGSD